MNTHVLEVMKNVLGYAILVKFGFYARNHVVDDGSVD